MLVNKRKVIRTLDLYVDCPYTVTYETCDNCNTEHNSVEYFRRILKGVTQAVCPSCSKVHDNV